MYNIEKLDAFEHAPIHLSRAQYLTQKYGDMWDLRRFDHSWYRSDKSDASWFHLNNIFKKFLGKSVDKAYSAYCKLVRFDEKEDFWKEFTNGRYYSPKYLIDTNKNIQLNPNRYKKTKKSIVFRSFDYQEGYYDITKKELVEYYPYYRHSQNIVYIVIQGYEKEFESKKDLEYIRLIAEKVKLIRLAKKYRKKLAKEKKYSFITEKEKQRRITELDIQKRDAHGFDEESFKGIEYHGQRRKR